MNPSLIAPSGRFRIFDETYYLRQNPDVAAAVAADRFTSGEDHFERRGQFENRSPSPYFDEVFYRLANRDVVEAIAANAFASGFAHFERHGLDENRKPTFFFDPAYYVDNNADVKAAILVGAVGSAFEHFIRDGAREGRSPMAGLDLAAYVQANPDVAAAIARGEFHDAFEHIMRFGRHEFRPGVPEEPVFLAGNPSPGAYTGTERDDLIFAGNGGDTINGLAGDDTIEGGNGADRLDGGPGDDEIEGENGPDILAGGTGVDRLKGGNGPDVFVFRAVADSPVAAPDTIRDFTPLGATDVIAFQGLLHGTFQFRGGAGAAFLADGNSQARFNDATKILEVDTDGNGSPDMAIRLEGVLLAALSAADFTWT